MTMSTEPRRLFLPIETKVREFHGKLFFALSAAERGYEVILGGQHALRERLSSLGSGLYIDKSIAATKTEWFARVNAMPSVAITAWDEEGLVYFDHEIYRELRASRKALKEIALFFAWGPDQAAAVQPLAEETGTEVIVSGNPRFDLLRPELLAFYRPAVDALRQRFGRYLLINTAFPFANHAMADEDLEKKFAAYPIARMRPDFFRHWVETQGEACEGFRQMLPVLHDAFPEHRLIVRPHPSENRAYWEAAVADLERAEFHAEGAVVPWIMGADAIVHFNCTTAIEAQLVGVPPVAYRPVSRKEFEQDFPNAVSRHAFNEAELLAAVRQAVDQGMGLFSEAERKTFHDRIRAHISGLDEARATDVILDRLDDVPMPSPGMAREGGAATGEAPVDIVRRAWRAWLKILRGLRARRHHQYGRQKFPGLSLEEVLKARDDFRAVTGRFRVIGIEDLGGDCFRIGARAEGTE